jgi:hypothetical protein
MSWLTIKAKLALIGAVLLSVLAVFARLKLVEHQRDKQKVRADILDARLHIQKVQKKIVKEERDRLLSEEESLSKELSKKGEEFEGVDNLSDPNNF